MVDTTANSESTPSKPPVAVILASLVICAFLTGLLFIFARQSGLTLGRVYLGLLATHVAVCHGWVLIWNPVVIQRRMWPGPGVKAWAWVLSTAIAAVIVAIAVVAEQDLGTRDVDPPLGVAWLISLAIFGAGWTLVTWSMVSNPFFEKTVRIQTNHGHHVIDSGPYAVVRHPGYVGFVAVLLTTPLLLASAWTSLPALTAATLFVIRTALEDRSLGAELLGYKGYAERVRFRLIPGLWWSYDREHCVRGGRTVDSPVAMTHVTAIGHTDRTQISAPRAQLFDPKMYSH